MRTLFDFRVEPALPEALQPLRDIAHNIWWSWNPAAIELFRRTDDVLWEAHRNPVLLLASADPARLAELADDPGYLALLDQVAGELADYLASRTWHDGAQSGTESGAVAYFSMEFGLAECLKLYSGGLGVLAGDHLKAASDLGLPLVGVTLLFQQGYFEQYLNVDGWQQERYPVNDFSMLPIEPVTTTDGEQLRVHLRLSGADVAVAVWRCQVGRVALYCLDTNLPENERELRDITDQLYGGDQKLRIRQEIVLGIGGIRALHAMGIQPEVCHINEGHAAFSSLERICLAMRERDLSFAEARVAMGAGHVFTTHTPVQAGFDLFPEALVREHFAEYAAELGIKLDQLLGMGRTVPGDDTFNMAVMALRNSTYTNAVSALHGSVTRGMAMVGFPEFPEEEIPIGHVTNGIHVLSWISPEMSGLLWRYLGLRWSEGMTDPETWAGIDRIPDTELWRTHVRRRERLIGFARRRMRDQLAARGASARERDRADEVLDPRALTLGFARRFATYKRATLLLRDRDRLRHLLTDPARPVQLLFAGKAHPHDQGGKELIREIVHFAREENVRERIVFLEDYNITVARYLVQGVDVWLNTPRRPLEASGTSGMKVAVNGGLNLSVLDGWWAEAYRPDVGWAIGAGEEYDDHEYQDQVEADALFDLLEGSVVPLFFDRGRDNLPRRWIAMMKTSMRTLGPFFNTDRMVREYHDRYYAPAVKRSRTLAADGCVRARNLCAWRQKVNRAWRGVRIRSAEVEGDRRRSLAVGDEIAVRATVDLPGLTPDDVTVEAVVGRLDEEQRIRDGHTVSLAPVEALAGDAHLYRGRWRCCLAGAVGLSIRVLPNHPDLGTKFELRRMVWG